MARRNDLDICADILRVALTGANKTRIVYQANLNFKIVEKYLQRLVSNGLLQVTINRRFLTTRKGTQFLEQFQVLVAPMTEQEKVDVIRA